MNEQEILEIIAKALELEASSITMDSSSDNVAEWDSLGHLGVLVAMDKAFDGKLAGIAEMASADSVSKIIQVLKNNSFI